MSCSNCVVLREENEQLKSKCNVQGSVINQMRMEKRILEQEVEKLKKGEVEKEVIPKKRKNNQITKIINVTEFCCNKCDPPRYLVSEASLQAHDIRSHGNNFSCTKSNCTQAFGRNRELKDHLNTEHSMADPYLCNEDGCKEQFATYSSRRNHYLRVHSTDYVCPNCRKKLPSQTRLDSHVAMDSCQESEEVKKAKKVTMRTAAAATGTAMEENILAWFEEKHGVELERVGGISKYKKHIPSGNTVNGSCDGLNSVDKYIVEVKVLTTSHALSDVMQKKVMLLKSSPALQELLKGMFVHELPTGYLVYFYTIEQKHYEFKVQWKDYEKYFCDFIKLK